MTEVPGRNLHVTSTTQAQTRTVHGGTINDPTQHVLCRIDVPLGPAAPQTGEARGGEGDRRLEETVRPQSPDGDEVGEGGGYLNKR